MNRPASGPNLRAGKKTNNPQPSERQVHPIASNGLPYDPNVHTNRFCVHPKVLSCTISGKASLKLRPWRPSKSSSVGP
jgi:hypothetical protein